MIPYISDPKSSKKLLNLIMSFSNIQKSQHTKSLVFVYTNNEMNEKKIMAIIPFTIQ